MKSTVTKKNFEDDFYLIAFKAAVYKTAESSSAFLMDRYLPEWNI